MGRDRLAKAFVVGFTFLLVLFECLLYLRVEWVCGWFYALAWWCYIPIADGIVYLRRGNSLILSRTREFLLLIPWSLFLWLFFELLNLRLGNWHYENAAPEAWLRWVGYAICFATVLPGLFETLELLEAFGLFRNVRFAARPLPRWIPPLFYGMGIAFLALPLAFPMQAFPLVWGALIFLLEPVNYRMGAPSLLADSERGEPARFLNLLAAGAICGLLWEFWNYWATTKWVYDVPFVGESRLFEMPVAGFAGFPPFAVECYVFWNFIRACDRRLTPAGRVAVGVALAVFCAAAIHATDVWTIRSFAKE